MFRGGGGGPDPDDAAEVADEDANDGAQGGGEHVDVLVELPEGPEAREEHPDHHQPLHRAAVPRRVERHGQHRLHQRHPRGKHHGHSGTGGSPHGLYLVEVALEEGRVAERHPREHEAPRDRSAASADASRVPEHHRPVAELHSQTEQRDAVPVRERALELKVEGRNEFVRAEDVSKLKIHVSSGSI